MSNTITSIGASAFSKCRNLDSETCRRIKDIRAGRPHQSGISKVEEKREPKKKGKKDNAHFESSFQKLNVSKVTMPHPKAEALKLEGNSFFKSGQYQAAIDKYDAASEIDSNVPAYQSNAAACYEKLGDYSSMEAAARKCISANKSFVRGYFRLATALKNLNDLSSCIKALESGLAVQSTNADLKKMMKEVKELQSKEPEKKGKKDNSQFESSFQQLNVSKGWDLFISHSTKDDSHDVYIAVSNYMKAKDLNIFNPTVHLTHYDEINVQAMQDAVAKSKFVIAALSDGFFESEWCKKEIEAARDNGIKVIPVYSGDDYGNKQIDKWVKTFTKDSSFKYIFKENARDVLNKQNTGSTYKTLKHLAELAKKN